MCEYSATSRGGVCDTFSLSFLDVVTVGNHAGASERRNGDKKAKPYKSILKSERRDRPSSTRQDFAGEKDEKARPGSEPGAAPGSSSWKVTRMKLAAVRAFQEQVRKDYKGSIRTNSRRKYNEKAVQNLLSEMQKDLETILRGSRGSASAEGKERRSEEKVGEDEQHKGEASFELHEKQLLASLQDAESYLNMKEKWVKGSADADEEGARAPGSSASSGVKKKTSAAGSKFKAAVNAVMFVGATKSKVRFTTKTVREFNRSSSFWDHEFWDGQEHESLSTVTNQSASLNSSAASILKESWMNEWESRVSVMPAEKDLTRACLKLVVIWVESGHLSSSTGQKSPKWERKFGKLSPADMIYHRVARYPAIALRKLAELCHRPPQFFLDDKKRQEVALVYLYDALAAWEQGEVEDMSAVVEECREEIERQARQEREEKQRPSSKKGNEKQSTAKQKWTSFMGKIRSIFTK